ncbi:hypothetical protein K474DRAFT_1664236 [Panus rudis PR-1116 ss-1]|nr:hypothetical protein K474DRAFT_1664236 [Panus rudis PR-1116 ss-1]
MKAPKKDKRDVDEDDIAFKEKKKQEEAALKAAKEKALKGTPSDCPCPFTLLIFTPMQEVPPAEASRSTFSLLSMSLLHVHRSSVHSSRSGKK